MCCNSNRDPTINNAMTEIIATNRQIFAVFVCTFEIRYSRRCEVLLVYLS